MFSPSNTRIRTNHIKVNRNNLVKKEGSFIVPTGFVPHLSYAYLDNAPIKDIPNISYDGNTFSFTQDNSFNEIILSFKKSTDAVITPEELTLSSVKFKDVYECATLQDLGIVDGRLNNLESTSSPLFGKKIAVIGDSITYGFIPRNYIDYPGQLNSYAQVTADKLGMTFQNKGVNGSTLAAKYVGDATNSPFVYRVTELDDDADFILVMGGTNDFRKTIPLGTISDTNETTFYGGLKDIGKKLYDKYFINQSVSEGKKKTIIFCTPIKLLRNSSLTSGGNGTLEDLTLWCNAIKEVAAFYSFKVLDFQNTSSLNPHISQTVLGTDVGYTGYYNPYVTDGTHPTQEGAEIMANALIGFLRTLK